MSKLIYKQSIKIIFNCEQCSNKFYPITQTKIHFKNLISHQRQFKITNYKIIFFQDDSMDVPSSLILIIIIYCYINYFFIFYDLPFPQIPNLISPFSKIAPFKFKSSLQQQLQIPHLSKNK